MPIVINREKLAYAAGLYDGEGCSRAADNGMNSRLVRLQVKMTDVEPLRKFWEALNYKAKIYGPYRQGKFGQNKQAFLVLIQNFEEFQYAMCLLWPWLSTPKKEQFKAALKYYHGYGKAAV